MIGQQFIQLAGALVANTGFGDASARNRTAISRAYYGVFHSAVELLTVFAVHVPQNHTGHQVAYQKLFQSGVQPAREAARLLNDLRGERNRADYQLGNSAPELSKNARQCVEAANDFCTLVERCLQEPIRSELSSALAP